MGLEDVLRSALGGQPAPESKADSLVRSIMEVLGGSRSQGLGGLEEGLRQQGLGDVLASWIGNGQNLPVSGSQIQSALGRDQVDRIAQRAGIPTSQAPGILASVLPALIDQLTPDGELPQQAALFESRGKSVLDRLKQAFGGSGRAQAEPARASAGRADFSDVQAGSSSTAPASAPEEPEETIHTVASGESLSKIAKRYYGDANAWRRIYEANREVVGENPDLIHPGQKLRIPQA